MVQPLTQWKNSSLSQALALCEEVLTKALAVSELEALALSERRLRKFLVASAWDIAKKANKWLVAQMPDEGEDLTGKQVDKLTQKYISFWKDFPEDTSDEIEKVTNEGYLAGKKVMIERAFGVGDAVYEPILKNQPELSHLTRNPEFLASYLVESIRKAVKPPVSKKKARQILAKIKPKFDLKDVRAAKELTRAQVFWVGEYFNKSLSKQISKVVKQIVIDEGLRAREAKDVLEETLAYYWDPKKPPKPITDFHIPSPPNMLPSEYWEAVAANAATVGRIQGSMRQLSSMNVTTYVVVNPVDERTCPVCGEMNGMVLNVNTSVESMDGLLGKSPEQIKKLHPWPPEKEQLAKIPEYRKEGDFKFIKSPSAQTKFQKEGRGYPSFHFRCRCSVDINTQIITQPVIIEPEIQEQLPVRNPPIPIGPKL